MLTRDTSKPALRLATSSGQREPGWRLTPDRRLRLVVSQAQPPDALDSEWELAEQKYPHLRHWVVQIKHVIREQRSHPRTARRVRF